jgi:uncharacterized protein (DUF983 family)
VAYRRVSSAKLLLRGLLLRCPYCGRPTLVAGLLRLHDRCSGCGLLFEHDEGFFLGALLVNYVTTALVGILPALVLVARGTWSTRTAIAWATVLCLVLPVAFYWHAKSLWMALFYCFLPEDLAPGDAPPKAAAQTEEDAILEEIAALEGGRREPPAGRRGTGG